MKKLIAALLLCVICIGCTEYSEKFTHDGHRYVRFHNVGNDARIVNTIHDPDCPCQHRHAERQ